MAGQSIANKIIHNRKLSRGSCFQFGNPVTLRVNQTLTQDSTGTMVYLQLEAMGIDKIKTDCSVAYIDHNMLQAGFENADDHAFIQSVAKKYGIIFSKPGNGICHQLHLEQFAKPGDVLIGSDSHTPTCGGLGMLAIGAGGLDVALGMAKGSYRFKMPKVMNIQLTGVLGPMVSAKDIILEILRQLSVKGGVGYIIEYSGGGLKSLSVPERATITNMGAELGATTSIFPSDERTLEFLKQHGRERDYLPLAADDDAVYDAVLSIDLTAIKPMVALPHSPDHVTQVQGTHAVVVDQVAIGSCTNSSYEDLMKVATILKGQRVHPNVSLVISPGSSMVLAALGRNGALADLIAAGARILEAGCGPCIGMGQAPKTNAVSLRTFNRNFKGRCGTDSASVYLVSPETAAVSALTGQLTCPQLYANQESISLRVLSPNTFEPVTSFWLSEPPKQDTPVIMGPNIQPFPKGKPLGEDLSATVLLKTNDHVTTDDIMPSGASLLPYRSNIPKLAEYAFSTLIKDFAEKAKAHGGGIVVGGENYGQGSSREHAALVPLYLGVSAVIAKSFARIHRANLVNAGIIPLRFRSQEDYDGVNEGDMLELMAIKSGLSCGSVSVNNKTKNQTFSVVFEGDAEELAILVAGGTLNYEMNREVL